MRFPMYKRNINFPTYIFIFLSSILFAQNKMNQFETISEEPINKIVLNLDKIKNHNNAYTSVNEFLENNEIHKTYNKKKYDQLVNKQNLTLQRSKPNNWNKDFAAQTNNDDIKLVNPSNLPKRLQKLSGDDVLIFNKSTFPAIDISETTGDLYITFNFIAVEYSNYPSVWVYKSSDKGATWTWVNGAYNVGAALDIPVISVLKDYLIVSYEEEGSIGILRHDISSANTGTTFKKINIPNSADASVNDVALWGSIISDKFYYDESNTWTYMNYLATDSNQKGSIYYLVSYDQGANWSSPISIISDVAWGMRHTISTGYTTPEPYTKVDYLWFTWGDIERNVYATEVDVYEVQSDVSASFTNHKIISDTDDYNAYHGTITTYFDKIFITGVIDWEQKTDHPITSNTNRDVYMTFSYNGGADWGTSDYSWYYWIDTNDKQEYRPVATYGTNGVLGYSWTYNGDLYFRTNSTGEFLQGWDKPIGSNVNSSGRIMIATAIQDSIFHYAYNTDSDSTGIYYNKHNMIKSELADLTGYVTSALDGKPIANATVNIAGKTTTTDNNGSYTLKDIKPGYINADFSSNTQKGSNPLDIKFVNLTSDGSQAINISATDYITYEGMIKLKPGNDYNRDFSLSPSLGSGEIRAVLNWGAVPYDLDGHLFTPKINGVKYHVFWADIGEMNDVPYVNLDHDDTLSYGPETITINRTYDGTYDYYVTNFSKASGIDTTYGFKDSEATVSIYNDQGKVATVAIPSAARVSDSLHWKVFSIDGSTGNFLIHNQLTNSRPDLPSGKLIADNQSMNFKLNNDQLKSIKANSTGNRNSFVNRLNKTSSDTISYLWNFGDGNKSRLEFPTHTYQSSGKYTVTLRSSDGAN